MCAACLDLAETFLLFCVQWWRSDCKVFGNTKCFFSARMREAGRTRRANSQVRSSRPGSVWPFLQASKRGSGNKSIEEGFQGKMWQGERKTPVICWKWHPLTYHFAAQKQQLWYPGGSTFAPAALIGQWALWLIMWDLVYKRHRNEAEWTVPLWAAGGECLFLMVPFRSRRWESRDTNITLY